MKIFGLTFNNKKNVEDKKVESFVPPSNDDGSLIAASNFYGLALDIDGIIRDENDLIRRYREAADYPDCSSAIDDICNEVITIDDTKPPVSVNLDAVKYSDSIKNKIKAEFDKVLQLYDFNNKSYDMFRQFYIDGKQYFHVIPDPKNPKNGIVGVRNIDPRKIKKIKEVVTNKDVNGVDVTTTTDEYYLYNDKGFNNDTKSGVRLSLDSIIYISSGLIDPNTGLVKSYLHKCIKIVNQLKMTEDSLVIYRFTRAPERRVFYIDVGDLPKIKADQYVQDTMARFRNKLVYNSSTGEIADDRKSLSMLEDYWMPRRTGGRSTEIETLPGGSSLGSIDDIQYFQNKLYRSLNVPISRLIPEQGFSIGRSQETSRDEIKFSKFVTRLRSKFSQLLLQLLRIQLISKGIVSIQDWEDISNKILITYLQDNHFAELKDNDILQGRLSTLQIIDSYVGKYYSVEWVRKNVLKQSDEEMKLIDDQNKQNPPESEDQDSEDDTQTDNTESIL